MEAQAQAGSGEDHTVERGSILKKTGRGPNYGRVKGEFLTKLHKEYIAGSSYTRLGTKYNLSPTSIHRGFKLAGLPTRTIQESNSEFSEEHKRNLKLAINKRWESLSLIDRRVKGNGVSYGQMHRRLIQERGSPSYCTRCDTTDPSKKYHWANLTGHYEDTQDYTRMCASCHRIHDAENRKQIKEKTGEWPKPIRPNWGKKYG